MIAVPDDLEQLAQLFRNYLTSIRSLGIDVPLNLLARADEVIE